MTLFDWITLIILILAAVTVLVLVFMHWNRLRRIDVEAMPAAKLRSKKYKLIEGRLQRRTSGVAESMRRVTGPAYAAAQKAFRAALNKLHSLERKYRTQGEQSKPKTKEEVEMTRQKITTMLERGAEEYKKDNFGDAEQIFLDVIRLNPKEVEAYEYLGEIYTAKKEYDNAIETLDFAKKLNPADDRIYYDIGMVYKKKGDSAAAMDMLQKAVELAPKSPKNLSALLDEAVEAKDRFVARETLFKLKEANPENQRLEELEELVKAL